MTWHNGHHCECCSFSVEQRVIHLLDILQQRQQGATPGKPCVGAIMFFNTCYVLHIHVQYLANLKIAIFDKRMKSLPHRLRYVCVLLVHCYSVPRVSLFKRHVVYSCAS